MYSMTKARTDSYPFLLFSDKWFRCLLELYSTLFKHFDFDWEILGFTYIYKDYKIIECNWLFLIKAAKVVIDICLLRTYKDRNQFLSNLLRKVYLSPYFCRCSLSSSLCSWRWAGRRSYTSSNIERTEGNLCYWHLWSASVTIFLAALRYYSSLGIFLMPIFWRNLVSLLMGSFFVFQAFRSSSAL